MIWQLLPLKSIKMGKWDYIETRNGLYINYHDISSEIIYSIETVPGTLPVTIYTIKLQYENGILK